MIENPVEWFQNKTLELENDSKRKDVLLEIKAMVLNTDKKVLSDIVHNVTINPVFECLSKVEGNDVYKLICVILSELLNQMSGSELLVSYGALMQKYLSHRCEEVKGTVLNVLEKKVDEKTIGILINKHASLLVDAIACIESQDWSTARGAVSLLIKLGKSDEGLNILYSDMVLNKLKEVMKTNDTVTFRVYEIIVAVSKLSSENLSRGISSGLMESLLSEVSSSDVLFQLCALELLSSLAESDHGLIYLQEHKVVQTLVDKLLKLNEEPLSDRLLPGLIEFFGNLCTSQPECFTSKYPQVMDLLFNSLETDDEVLLGVIITTVGKIGSTHAGRLVLNKYGDQFKKNFLMKIGKILSTKNNLTISAMSSLSTLMRDINGDANDSKITKEWFLAITPNALDSIVSMSKLPFIECRLAAFALLKAIATQQWGAEKLSNYPGMIEFLTDRSAEFDKDCKEMKFGIVFNMLQCSNIDKVLNEQNFHNLREFVKEGPFYVPTVVEMATEGC